MNYTIYIYEKKMAPFFMDNIKEYTKRLGRYCKIQIIPLKKEQDIEKIKQTGGIHCVLTEKGNTFPSEAFADWIHQLEVHGTSSCTFYIHCEPPFEWNEEGCISKLTMAPGLTAAILCEQIYRAYRIIHGQPYHK